MRRAPSNSPNLPTFWCLRRWHGVEGRNDISWPMTKRSTSPKFGPILRSELWRDAPSKPSWGTAGKSTSRNPKNGSLQKWSITGQHIQPAQLQRLPTLVQGRPICFFLRGNPTTNSSQTKGQDPFYTFFPWQAIKHAAGTRRCLGWKVAGDLPNLWPPWAYSWDTPVF